MTEESNAKPAVENLKLQVGQYYKTDSENYDIIQIESHLVIKTPMMNGGIHDHVVLFHTSYGGDSFYFNEDGVGVGGFNRNGALQVINIIRPYTPI